jgi:hypothetical protein
MDSVRADLQGAQPIHDELARIEAIASREALLDEIGRLEARGVRAPFGVGVQQDAKNSTVYRIHFSQSGLGLPDRDYYTKDDEASKKLRDQYVAHVTKMFTLIGDEPGRRRGHCAEGADDGNPAGDGLDDPRPAPRPERRLPHDAARLGRAAHAGDRLAARVHRDGRAVRGPGEHRQPDFFRTVDGLVRDVRSPTGRPTCAGTSPTRAPTS